MGHWRPKCSAVTVSTESAFDVRCNAHACLPMLPVLHYLTCDATTATLYASCGYHVAAWRWDASQQTLVAEGGASAEALKAASSRGRNFRPVVVMPASRGAPKCLVVGTHYTAELRIISLPDYTLLRTAVLPGGLNITGLAADPSGESIVAFHNSANQLHVLKWPIPEAEGDAGRA